MQVRELTLLGMMAAAAVLMQSAGAFWPGPGYLIAAMASLPLAVGGWLAGSRAVLAWAAATAVLVMIHPEEALVFGLTTGPVGLVAGWGERWHWGLLLTIAAGGLVLTLGMMSLAYGVGLLPLGPVAHDWGGPAYLCFGLLWAGLWVWVTRTLVKRLRQLRNG